MSDILLTRVEGPIAVLTMNRPEKRNAMSDGLIGEIDAFFTKPPDGVKVVVPTGEGDVTLTLSNGDRIPGSRRYRDRLDVA